MTLATIAQSSSDPCALNTILLRFKFNSDIVCASSITISGLTSILRLVETFKFNGDGWSGVDRTADSLMPQIRTTLNKSETVEISFSFQNPGMYVIRQAVAPTAAFSLSGNVLDLPQIVNIPQDVHRQALTIARAAFSTAIIHSIPVSPWSDVNTVTVTLMTTKTLVSKGRCASIITITGLQGACESQNILQVRGDSDSISHMPGDSSGGTAFWNNTLSSVTMYIRNDSEIEANRTYVLSFNMTNPALPQDAQTISISASGVQLLPFKMTEAPDTKAGLVSWRRTARFKSFRIGQNSSQPGGANELCVTFSTNVLPLPPTPFHPTPPDHLVANSLTTIPLVLLFLNTSVCSGVEVSSSESF